VQSPTRACLRVVVPKHVKLSFELENQVVEGSQLSSLNAARIDRENTGVRKVA
jgi:hypothetical protein